MPISKQIEDALASPNPFEALRAVAIRMIAEGFPPSAVADHFESVRALLRLAGRNGDEDIVMDVMDCLVGWCSPAQDLSAKAPGQFPGKAEPSGETTSVPPPATWG